MRILPSTLPLFCSWLTFVSSAQDVLGSVGFGVQFGATRCGLVIDLLSLCFVTDIARSAHLLQRSHLDMTEFESLQLT